MVGTDKSTVEGSAKPLGVRLAVAVAYLAVGAFLTSVIPFYFSPWWLFSWIHFGVLVVWAALGVKFDPFRFGAPLSAKTSGVGRMVRRYSLVILTLLLLVPLILWVAGLYWFLPWLPWRQLAYLWILRETVVATLFAVVVPMIWPAKSFGRQLAILILVLLFSHLSLLLTYAAISGGPDYLRDGETQNCFLEQLQFKLAAGTFAFVGLRLGARVFGRRWFSSKTWLLLGTVPVVGAAAIIGFGFTQQAKEGPKLKGKTIGTWISEASYVSDASDPAAQVLRESSDLALPYLLRALKDGKARFFWFGSYSAQPPREIRDRAAEVLISFGPLAAPAVPGLLECFRQGDAGVRKHLVEVFVTAGVSNLEVRKELLGALSDKECQYEAALTLGILGHKDTKVVYELAAIAKAGTEGAPYWATVALAQLGAEAKPALPVLLDVVTNSRTDARQSAVQAIALIGPEAESAIPALLDATKMEQSWLRKCAIIALGRVGPAAKTAAPKLQAMIQNETDYTKADIARTLWQIDPSYAEVSRVLATSILAGELKKASQSFVVASTLELLGEMGTNSQSSLPVVLEGLKSDAPMVRLAAAWTASRIDREQTPLAMQVFSNLLVFDHYAGPNFGPSEIGKALAELKREESSYPARLAAAGALWQLSPSSRMVLKNLVAGLLRDWRRHMNSSDRIRDEKVLIPILQDILNDSAFSEIHPTAEFVLLEITGTHGMYW